MSNKIDLTVSEMGFLWNSYQAESMNWCILKYFEKTVEDEQTKEMNDQLLKFTEKSLHEIKTTFELENFPIPTAFSSSDLNSSAEKLFTDPFILYFLWFKAKGNVNYGSIATNKIAREDVVSFFTNQVKESLAQLNKVRDLLLEKGLWQRSPYIPVPKEVSFIKKQSFLNGWFGDKRPLIAEEISSIFYNIITNQIGEQLMKGFIQSLQDGEVKDYLKRGKEIAEKHITVLSKPLSESELPVPSFWNAGVTSTTTSPFSEKLILNMVAFLNAQGVSNYGIAISTSFRRDIGSTFTRLATEVAQYAEDGVNLLIEKGWMETPPQAPVLE
ncbi:DUF3231 family protein [Cytobacillus sp. FJAT-54145]|uniref:DUF3231 family protein n=1 Tax=Cytobacillus spartinae TaxID=3299023 RepID=A0ABW6K948_9BACI